MVDVKEAAALIRKSTYTVAFTGAGISVESGVPPFRGENGLWSKYDPALLELSRFEADPLSSWKVIKEIFYDNFSKARPNHAHEVLAELERKNLLKAVITQNIDNLHQEAGSKVVHEFHGNSKRLITLDRQMTYAVSEFSLEDLPPRCKKTGEALKPDFIFFGESIPGKAYADSMKAAGKCQVMIVIGTTGEVMPASQVPIVAKQNGAKVIEINTSPSTYTRSVTDIFLAGKASEVLRSIREELFNI